MVLFLVSPAISLAEEISGLVIPRDNEGMYVRNEEGQFEIEWTGDTKVALVVNTRQFREWKGDRLEYRVHSSKEVLSYPLPAGPIMGVVRNRGGKHLETALAVAKEEKWIPEFGLQLYFNEKPEAEQLPSEGDPRFVGTWNPKASPRTLAIGGTDYELSLKKGGQTSALCWNLLTVKDCKPFIHRARVVGEKKGEVIVAKEIHLTPIGDQASKDDPKLPRYLFIGDSISGNYDQGLRGALAGKFNIHHPPTNCGPAGNGAKNIVAWLGAYEEPGRHWDVISFNHGHWDAGRDKASYQRDLEKVIAELKKTKAKLVWVTTCPVPNGFPAAGEVDEKGKAPGRTAGVMKTHLNPWAAEVMKGHPEISICDQWQFVKDDEKGFYAEWWKGKDVHFRGEPAAALGQVLAEHVLGIGGAEVK